MIKACPQTCKALGCLLLPLAWPVQAVPVITGPPPPVTVVEGQPASLGVTAEGAAPLAYQWYRNGIEVPGATGATHTISSLDHTTTGLWSVRVTDGTGGSVLAFCRVSHPGAVISWQQNGVLNAVSHTGSAVPVSLAAGDAGLAIGSLGEVLRIDTQVAAVAAGSPQAVLAALGQPVVDMAVSEHRAAVLLADGTVRAWEGIGNWEGFHAGAEIMLPPDMRRGTALAVRGTHLLVVRWDGTVGVLAAPGSPLTQVPAGLAHAVAVAAGDEHAAALLADGTVVHWGNLGQVPPLPVSEVVQLLAGSGWTMMLRRDGSTVRWERSSQLLSGPQTLLLSAPPVPGAACRRLGCDDWRTAGILTDGRAQVWQSTHALAWAGWGWQPAVPPPNPVPPQAAEAFDVGVKEASFIALCHARAPVIEVPPAPTSVRAGETAHFSVQATGRPLTAFQWQRDGVALEGEARPVLTITGVQAAQAGSYTVTVSNPHGSVTSTPPATLQIVTTGPRITAQPQNVALRPGQSGMLSVAASGTGALGYQWHRDGRALPGETSATLTLPADSLANAAVYQVVVHDATGTCRSRLVLAGPGCTAAGWSEGTVFPLMSRDVSHDADVLLALSTGEARLGLGANGRLNWFYQQLPSGNRALFVPAPMSYPRPGMPVSQVPGFSQVAVRGNLGLALAEDGEVWAWESQTSLSWLAPAVVGYTGYGSPSYSWSLRRLDVPAAAHGAISVTLSRDAEALALRTDGSVTGWNARWGTRSAVPAAAGAEIVAISSGADHHLALRADGTVIAWGNDDQGECQVPAGMEPAVEIAALEDASFAIHADGSVTHWGSTADGRAAIPAGLPATRHISGFGRLVIATHADGSLTAWGDTPTADVPPLPGMVTGAGGMPGLTAETGVALVPAPAPQVSLRRRTQRVFPGWSGTVADIWADGFPQGTRQVWWERDGAVVRPAGPLTHSNSALSVTNATLADAGTYRCVVANEWGTSFSEEVTLQVVAPRLFTAWQAQHFTPQEIAAGLAAPGADPDGGGVTNFMRYATGLPARGLAGGRPPLSQEFLPPEPGHSPFPGLMSLGLPARLRLAFEVPLDTADVTARLEYSTDLVHWHDSHLPPQLGEAADGRRRAWFDASAPGGGVLPTGQAQTGRVFYRVVFSLAAPALSPGF